MKKSTIQVKKKYADRLSEQGPINIEARDKYPYSAIGVVHGLKSINKGVLPTFGTGCIIGPNIVLTCAHNCYSLESH